VSNVHGTLHSTTRFEAHVIVGGVVSTTSIVWLHVLELPQASVADQVRVAVKVLPQCWFVTVPTITGVTFVTSQMSATVGVSKFHGLAHSTTRLDAQARTGGVVSTTVTVWLHVLEFPHKSV